ncbi:HAMP domain-containing histidine kinase [bacterium]|nr:HAMP domain-containing histidine kinase [bacterium]MBU1995283.1 HAMP domain-containing histidine kinase [bacterium]
MHRHEKLAFLKFFVTYFISIAIFILFAGFFYFSEVSNHLLKTEEFSLIEYARHIKMGNTSENFSNDYHHTFIKSDTHIDIKNFTINDNEFIKFLPMRNDLYYLKVFKSKKDFTKNLWGLKQKIVAGQILLLLIFAYISYRLAKNALKPLQESILTLDKFAKDLIHDLNTPVTAIKLNLKLLEKIWTIKENNAFIRLQKSVNTISELHENLTILLQEETFQMQLANVFNLVEDVVQIQKTIYPNIDFKIESSNFKAKINPHAMKQILQNIISNACKYNSQNGYVNIYAKENSLYIQDSGKGIKEPSKIFERSYSGEHSSGIGLDIVKRLANAMNIKIEAKSNTQGTVFILTMR